MDKQLDPRYKKLRYKKMEARLLPQTWRDNLAEYALWCRIAPRKLKKGAEGLCEDDRMTREQAIAHWKRLDIPHDETGRAVPFRSRYHSPFYVIHFPTKTSQRLDYEDYDEYLRTYCQMLDTGMEVKQTTDDDMYDWFYPYNNMRE